MKQSLLLTLLLAALLSACAASPAGSSEPQGSWVLASLDGSTEVGAAMGGKDITLEFIGDGRVAGSAGCNQYNASYTLNGSSISFLQPASTLMACFPEIVMQNEAAFLQVLTAATEFELVGDTLTITGGGHALVFTR